MPASQDATTELSVKLRISSAARHRLSERAAQRGLSVAEYVGEVMRRLLEPSFAEVSRPFASAMAASGMNDDEVEALIEQARSEVWQERQSS